MTTLYHAELTARTLWFSSAFKDWDISIGEDVNEVCTLCPHACTRVCATAGAHLDNHSLVSTSSADNLSACRRLWPCTEAMTCCTHGQTTCQQTSGD